MNVEIRYWKWNENFSPVHYKLGDKIENLLAKGLVKATGVQNEYKGKDEVPWKITVADKVITSIYFRDKFFPLTNKEIWNLELKDVERELDGLFKRVSKEDHCDKLVVVFRESFVAIAGIQAWSEEK